VLVWQGIVAAFQAGHEGSIPFARSNQKPQASALDLLGLTGGTLAVMTHPRQEVLETCAAGRSERVPGMP